MHYNIGCGHTVGKNWINVDSSITLAFERIPIVGRIYTKNTSRFPDCVIYGDITKQPLCREGTAEAVFCSHMLEHVPHNQMLRALRHIHFMLKGGGIFRLVVPCLESRVRDYMDHFDGDRLIESLRMGVKQDSDGVLARIRRGLRNSGHRWMYDMRSMSMALAETGFVRIRECDFGDCREVPLFVEVEDIGRFYRSTSREAQDKEVCIECRKPCAS